MRSFLAQGEVVSEWHGQPLSQDDEEHEACNFNIMSVFSNSVISGRLIRLITIWSSILSHKPKQSMSFVTWLQNPHDVSDPGWDQPSYSSACLDVPDWREDMHHVKYHRCKGRVKKREVGDTTIITATVERSHLLQGAFLFLSTNQPRRPCKYSKKKTYIMKMENL